MRAPAPCPALAVPIPLTPQALDTAQVLALAQKTSETASPSRSTAGSSRSPIRARPPRRSPSAGRSEARAVRKRRGKFSRAAARGLRRLLMGLTLCAAGPFAVTTGQAAAAGATARHRSPYSRPTGGGRLRLFKAGVWHILSGIDHLLFLLSLLLPAVLLRKSGRWEPVHAARPALIGILKVVTAFTLAHSITLSLAALDVIRLPSRLTESVDHRRVHHRGRAQQHISSDNRKPRTHCVRLRLAAWIRLRLRVVRHGAPARGAPDIPVVLQLGHRGRNS